MYASPPERRKALWRVRVATWLFPPWGLWRLWRAPEFGFTGKCFGTIIVALYSVLYVTVGVLLLMRFTGLEIEWRGGFPPVLTYRKTHPNYRALETHRAAQTNAAAPTQLSVGGFRGPAPYWTGFRGPQRDGVYRERALPTNWPAGGWSPLWRQPVGGGYASFAVAEGMAFTLEQRRDQEAVTAYDVATGRELWAHAYPALFEEWMGGPGPRATPTWHDGRLFSLGAEGDLKCFEARTGGVLWEKDVLAEHAGTNLNYGVAASPLAVDNRLIVLPGQSVVAYDPPTGQRRWRVLESERGAYASPVVVTLAGQRQLLVVMARRVVGLKVEDGALLWDFPWQVQHHNSIAQPVVWSSNQFVLSGGYGAGCVGVEIEPTSSGLRARERWRNKNLKNKFASSVCHDGFIYGLDEDLLVCLDAATGERRWKSGRYGYGQLLLAGDQLIILSGQGELALVEASPAAHQEHARFPALRGKSWNVPALADGKLFVRNAVEMACFDLLAAAEKAGGK